MKKFLAISLLFLATAFVAEAQIGASPSTDVLGAHLNYGRGCAACHAPHSGAFGNGAANTGDTTSGNIALWGEDVASLSGKTIVTGQSEHGSYSETLPTVAAGTPDVSGVLMCLSCHDGNFAAGAMMKNKVYETLPPTYGNKNDIPTLLGSDKTGSNNYLNDHPVGLNAVMTCGGTYDWDCSINAGKVLMNGPNSIKFVNNYGFFVSPGVYNNQPVVMCTTCHNQHLMNVVKVTTSTASKLTIAGYPTTGGTVTGLPSGYYATMFFVRAPYNPADANPLTNQTAQFCRQCHGGEANESNNGTAGTVF